MNKNKKEQEELKASVKAYVLNKDVSSGQVITCLLYTSDAADEL